MVDINWDERALAVFITSVEESLVPDLAEQVAEVATAIAPVRARHTSIPEWAKRGYVGAPGRLKASIRYEVDRDVYGVFADISSEWYGRFLDPPARQMHRIHPLLPSALYFVLEGRTYYL